MSKRKHSEPQPTSPTPSNSTTNLYESTAIHDRSSKFIAIFTPSTTSPRSLQQHKPFESAGHKILAWRKTSTQKSLAGSFGSSAPGNTAKPTAKVLETGSDEDGEKWAGKKLEKVLTDLDVEGVVCVFRWYGGVMLGPVRFKWIEDSAREAVLKWKASVGSDPGHTGEAKRLKVDETEQDDSKAKDGLMRVLRERDASIGVLRSLLADKNVELKRMQLGEDGQKDQVDDKQDDVVKSPSVVVPEYDGMSLTRLKQMEKARDATLGWILKQIDLVEVAIKKG